MLRKDDRCMDARSLRSARRAAESMNVEYWDKMNVGDLIKLKNSGGCLYVFLYIDMFDEELNDMLWRKVVVLSPQGKIWFCQRKDWPLDQGWEIVVLNDA